MTDMETADRHLGAGDGAPEMDDLLQRVREAVRRTREVIEATRETLSRPLGGEDTQAGGD
jgi:hypothetical protein